MFLSPDAATVGERPFSLEHPRAVFHSASFLVIVVAIAWGPINRFESFLRSTLTDRHKEEFGDSGMDRISKMSGFGFMS